MRKIAQNYFINPFLLFLAAGFSIVHAQDIVFQGIVMDTSQMTLPNANVLAFTDSDDEKTRFAISNEIREYSLKLSKGESYKKINYLGYQKTILYI